MMRSQSRIIREAAAAMFRRVLRMQVVGKLAVGR